MPRPQTAPEHPGGRAKPLWTCPDRGKRFVSPNLWHSCTTYTLDEFFESKTPRARALFDAYLDFVRRTCGDVLVNVDKTRISFQERTRFAGVPRVTKDAILIGFWLKKRIESPRFERVEFIPPRSYVYEVRLTDPRELDAELASWLREAQHTTGMQTSDRLGGRIQR